MGVLDFCRIFAHKFSDKIGDMQENDVKKSAITINDYYAKLTKTEKSQILTYLIAHYGFRYNTIQQKLTGKSEFNPRDLLVVKTVIKEELWRSN